MMFFRRIGCGAVLGAWALLLAGSPASAESNSEAASTTTSGRASWQQRVTGGSRARPVAHAGRSSAPQMLDIAFTSSEPTLASPKTSATPETILPGMPTETITMDFPGDPMFQEPFDGGYGGGCSTGGSNSGYGDPYGAVVPGSVCFSTGWLRRLSFTTGVQGFKGPADLGRNGNFGFNYGVNYGGSLGGPHGIGFQAGFQGVSSNFHGDQITGQLNDGDRDQIFFTTGIFKRALHQGLQWGVVYDMLRDNYYEEADMSQIRVEISSVRRGDREIGFWGAFRTGSADVDTEPLTGTLNPVGIYSLFYRQRFEFGGSGRFWAGGTDQGDGILGVDAEIPISDTWSMRNSFTYLMPGESRANGAQQEEAWNVMIQFVWYPGRSARNINQDWFQPLFDVAHNGNFLVDRN